VIFKNCLFCACILALFGLGCARSPKSPEIPPAQDPTAELRREQIDDLLSQPELILEAPRDYYIGPGDVLSIALLGRTDILRNSGTQENSGQEGLSVRVTETPTITLPLVGAVHVHGKTVNQLQQELTAAYSRYVKDPVVVVSIEEYYQNQVSVLGAVNDPGRHPWQFGDTVLDSLFKAGGLAFASKGGGLPPGRYLRVFRQKLSQKERSELSIDELFERLSENNRLVPREEIVVPIEEFILNGNLMYNIPVRPGDIIYVPTAGSIIVEGHVRAPGVTYLGPSLRTLTHVITERGGLRYGADSDIELVRTFPSGAQQSYFLNARAMVRRHEPDFLLQDGDQIFVYKHPARYTLEILSTIFRTSANAGLNATYSPTP
jgi:protein involved in polysaccharide export with SLBB domain